VENNCLNSLFTETCLGYLVACEHFGSFQLQESEKERNLSNASWFQDLVSLMKGSKLILASIYGVPSIQETSFETHTKNASAYNRIE